MHRTRLALLVGLLFAIFGLVRLVRAFRAPPLPEDDEADCERPRDRMWLVLASRESDPAAGCSAARRMPLNADPLGGASNMKLVLAVLVVALGAVGAVIVARRRNPTELEAPPGFLVLEADSPAISESGALTQSVGIGIVEGRFAPLLERGSTQPVETSFTFSTSEDDQEQITLRFYRGNSDSLAENTFLGEGRITGYPLSPAEEPLVRVFVRAAKGQLSLAAVDDHTGKPVRLTRTRNAAARVVQ